ncbi:hypothetical protein GCM10010495_74010 [Kitasatospora herbaricolor]|nr:hypothetical protein GCM10010495_74010 [Kitasatospora herbaricolor]
MTLNEEDRLPARRAPTACGLLEFQASNVEEQLDGLLVTASVEQGNRLAQNHVKVPCLFFLYPHWIRMTAAGDTAGVVRQDPWVATRP